MLTGKTGRNQRRSRNRRKAKHRAKYARDRGRGTERDRFEISPALADEIDAALQPSDPGSRDRQPTRN